MGFVGESGAGKSTTIKMILDLVRCNSGTITVFGQDGKSVDNDMREKFGVAMDESFFSDL